MSTQSLNKLPPQAVGAAGAGSGHVVSSLTLTDAPSATGASALSWPPDYNELNAFAHSGASQQQVAAHYGRAYQTLQYTLQKYGIAWPHGRGHRTKRAVA